MSTSWNGVVEPPLPRNEVVEDYRPGSPAARALAAEVEAQSGAQPRELTMTIAGREVGGEGDPIRVVQPHAHQEVLGVTRQAGPSDVAAAVDAAVAAGPGWAELSFPARAAVFLRAADLLCGPWRDRMNAATMLGQSKTSYQAEIDAVCELADFWRYNVAFATRLLADQPASSPGTWNRADYRPLEGFVLAVTPFNFTAIAGNLPTAPALMGNTVVWKPSPTQTWSAWLTMRLLEAAGLPPGVINMVTGDGAAVSQVALGDPRLAGVHFTGSTATFQAIWQRVAAELPRLHSYPRLVGETGGKDFVLAHPSADPGSLVTALLRGAFDYQGQKCSAASRAYLPRSLWEAGVRDALLAAVEQVHYGDVRDNTCFGGAVIDARAYSRLAGLFARLRDDPAVTVLTGGTAQDEQGWFVAPTVLTCADPDHEVFREEYFGPVLAVHVYDDRGEGAFEAVADAIAGQSRYALTGSVFATDRRVLEAATRALRFAAGNLYLNDKPTGAVVGQQPFGGGRASGTNDKAGSMANLARWVSPRVVKETFDAPREWRYPHQG